MSLFAVQVNTSLLTVWIKINMSLLTVWIKINMSLLTVWIKGSLLAVQKKSVTSYCTDKTLTGHCSFT